MSTVDGADPKGNTSAIADVACSIASTAPSTSADLVLDLVMVIRPSTSAAGMADLGAISQGRLLGDKCATGKKSPAGAGLQFQVVSATGTNTRAAGAALLRRMRPTRDGGSTVPCAALAAAR